MARLKVCAEPRCPELTDQRRCPAHTHEVDRARGSRQQRGYDSRHDRLRKQWQRKVETGLITCARCQLLIHLGQAWALDHTDDRAGYLGPSHQACNNSAGGRAAHAE
jgi:hypothetical protein